MVLDVQIPRLRSQRPVSACRIALSLLVAATGCGQRTTATNPGVVERDTPADATAAQHNAKSDTAGEGIAAGATLTLDGYIGFQPDGLDLGTHGWNRAIPFQLRFVNGGSEPISVADVSAPCACLHVDARAVVGVTLGPGESLDLPAVASTETRVGPVRRFVVLEDQQGTRWTARILWRVEGQWCVEPDRVDFREVCVDDASPAPSSELRFHASPAKLRAVTGHEDSWLRVQMLDSAEMESRIRFEVLKERLPLGSHSLDILLHTDSPAKPLGRIYVRAIGVGVVQLRPSRVVLRGTAEQRIVAEYPDGSPVRLVDAEAESNFIRVRVVDGSVLVDNPAGRPLEKEVLLRVVDERKRPRSVVVVVL